MNEEMGEAAALLPAAVSLRDSMLGALLSNTPIVELSPMSQSIVCVDAKASLEEALEVLSHSKLLSAPVHEKDAEKPLLGFIDVLDAVSYVVRACTNATEVEIDGRKMTLVSWIRNVAQISEEGSRFAAVPVVECINLSNENPFICVYGSNTASELLEVFARGVHRVPVMNAEGKMMGITSQGNVVRFMAEHVQLLGRDYLLTPISALGLVSQNPICMRHDSQAIHGFYLMNTHNVSAVGIIAGDGELVGNLSATDLRGLTRDTFSNLLLPVSDYLQLNSPKSTVPITCTLQYTIETVILKLAATKVHRLWVVDEANRPVGVLTLTDVLRLFSEQAVTAPTSMQM